MQQEHKHMLDTLEAIISKGFSSQDYKKNKNFSQLPAVSLL
jgi:hypothetical protein